MDLPLLEQFGQNFPEEFDGVLDCNTFSVTAVFNRRGTVLAVGSNDGKVFIWDFLTRGIAKIITAHNAAITSLSWSRNGKLLATSSMDCYVCVWDVLTTNCLIRWHFNTAIVSVQFSPRNQNILLIRHLKQPSLLVQYKLAADGLVESKTHKRIPHDDEADFDVVSSFDRRGEYVYSGNTKGRIQVCKLEPGTINVTVITAFRVSNTAIKQIEFAPKKKDIFMVNSADRTIRLYSTTSVMALVNGSASSNNTARTRKCVQGSNTASFSTDTKHELEPIQKLQDLVNRTTWKKCCFSGGTDSDFICAGSSRQHSIYIWDRAIGGLVTILHGTKGELLNDVIWHPFRPILASIANGVVSIWSQAQVENWSAFAPDFQELEENVEYVERESEFDEMDEDITPDRNDTKAKEDDISEVDIITPVPVDYFVSSDEETEDPDALVYFPMMIEMDDVELDPTEQSEEKLEENFALALNQGLEGQPKPLQPCNRDVDTLDAQG